MKITTYLADTLILRLIVALILLIHGLGGMFNGGVYTFGAMFLDQIGFAPVGVPLAWAIKISHVLAAFCIVFGYWVRPACIITILILLMGIVLVHFKEGWYVVGAGRNGVEFNVLLIAVLLTVFFQKSKVETNSSSSAPKTHFLA
jgi:putative oxidoreductase